MTLYERGDPKRNHTNLKNGRYRHAFSTPRNYSVLVHRTRVQGTRTMYLHPEYSLFAHANNALAARIPRVEGPDVTHSRSLVRTSIKSEEQ